MKSIGPIRIIDIYIIKEVLLPFIVGVAIVGIIMLSGFLFELTDLIIVEQVPWQLVLRLLLYKLPEIIVQTFPIAILLATMLGMGRLSRDNEFTAMRMGGISLYRFMIPLLILGILVSGLTYLFNEKIVPWSNHEAQNIIRRSILQETMPQVEDQVFFRGPQGRLFYVQEYNQQTNTLKKIVIYDFPDRKDYPVIITAEEGETLQGEWQLKQGIIHEYDSEGHLTLETQFDLMDIEIARDLDDFYGQQRTTSEMSREELEREIKLFQDSGLDVNSLLVDYHLKLATPLIALIFILLGAPLSLSSDSRAAGVVFTIIIVFLYYLLQSVARSLGRNALLAPIWAAWLPNIVFGVIGAALLLWRQHWENFVKKVLAALLPLLLLVVIFNPATAQAYEDTLRLEADRLEYTYDGRKMEIMDEITGQYRGFNIITERITIKFDDGSEEVYDIPQEILMDRSKFSGCDFDEPHYYFDAAEVTIYPGDYLVAKHVVFRELDGKLPLFYWPYLYISLKDEPQQLIPRVGYSNQRGWFLKTTYYYWLQELGLPGELYLDYYTRTGVAGGFKQHFIHELNHKGSFGFYAQQNEIDLANLFRWEASLDYFNYQGDWHNELELDYTRYQDYDHFIGAGELSRQADNWSLDMTGEVDNEDYFDTDSYDKRELDFDLAYQHQLRNTVELGSNLDLELDFGEGTDDEQEDVYDELELNYDLFYSQQLTDTVQLDLDYDRGYLLEADQDTQTRWGAEGAIAREMDNLDVELLVERYDPYFDEDDGVQFYRWPELNATYYPYQASVLEDTELRFSGGRYYEHDSGVESYRSLGELNYSNRWRPHNRLTLYTEHTFGARGYRLIESEEEFIPQQGYFDQLFDMGMDTYENQFSLTKDLTSHLSWINTYEYRTFAGETPFDFDREDFKEEVDSRLNYRRGRFSWQLETGYDIYNQIQEPIQGIMRWRDQNWRLSMGTTYDPEEGRFTNDLVTTSRYQREHLEHNTAFRYDLNNNRLRRWDNTLIYDVDEKWYVETSSSYDFEDDYLREANLALARNFHCRELRLSYDHLREEIMFEYRLNIFPEHRFQFGRTEEEDFMFDTGIRDLLDEE